MFQKPPGDSYLSNIYLLEVGLGVDDFRSNIYTITVVTYLD
jgi:hypothetical protein